MGKKKADPTAGGIRAAHATDLECRRHREVLQREIGCSLRAQPGDWNRLGGMSSSAVPTSYLASFQTSPSSEPQKVYTFDQLKDSQPYNQHTPRDTSHAAHAATSRKRCLVSLQTRRPLRSSQDIGWLPPIDINFGMGRRVGMAEVCQDRSHLAVGGPWSAR
eukprot:TRINITY_DN112195_c0_g1_i1.p1 TRINITY_DN112195_c0_g1~~TRINITY_DN112195_c0_g1_i1.p1  ORF type:complete len:162 (+),score=25.01 TRINITY_DN112195_c0_g1_i1:120-605(+)